MKETKLWKKLICLLSVEGQPIKAVLAQTCMGVFSIRSVSDTTFATLFLPKLPADRSGPPGCGPQFEKQWFNVWGLGCSNNGIMGSNPTQGMDVCLHLFVLCCSA
jgi:hypothetical protein